MMTLRLVFASLLLVWAIAAAGSSPAVCLEGGESSCVSGVIDEASSLMQTKQKKQLLACEDDPSFKTKPLGFSCKAIAGFIKLNPKLFTKLCSLTGVLSHCLLTCSNCGDPSRVTIPMNHRSVDNLMRDGVYITVGVGLPTTQEVALILDTGSSTFAAPPSHAIPCHRLGSGTCQFLQCPPGHPMNNCVVGGFDPNMAGDSFKPVPANDPTCLTGAAEGTDFCAAANLYGGGSSAGSIGILGWAGYWGNAPLLMGTRSATVTMVAITQLQQFQSPPAAGIFGIGLEPLNSLFGTISDDFNGEGDQTVFPTAISQYLEGNNLPNSFSLCMGTPSLPGALVMGEPDSVFQDDDFQIVPFSFPSSKQGFYNIEVEQVSVVSGESAPVSSDDPSLLKVTIIDSGNPFFALPTEVFDQLNNKAVCSTSADCVAHVTFNNGVDIVVPGVMVCNSVCTWSEWVLSSGGAGTGVLGYAVLRNFYTNFNRQALQYGFARGSSKCRVDDFPASPSTPFPDPEVSLEDLARQNTSE